jgi:hypothetical protein
VYATNGQQAYASTGAQAYASTGAQAYASTGAMVPVVDRNGIPIPHGQLVYNQIRNDLNVIFGIDEPPIPVTEFPTPMPGGPLIWFDPLESWSIDGSSIIYLVPVDTSNYRTTMVTQRITETINTLNSLGIERFVLNMSFVIMPCDLGLDISTHSLYESYMHLITTTRDIRGLEDTLNSLLSAYDINDPNGELAIRNNLLYGPAFGLVRILYFYNEFTIEAFKQGKDNYYKITNDRLKQWLENPITLNANDRVISVAAAGNFGKYGYTFPFAPAIWDSVVSVSATGWDPYKTEFNPDEIDYTVFYTPTTYSQPGEVIFNGQLNYTITNNAFPPEDVYYFGTSFAAPELSVREAFHLLNGGGVRCSDSQGRILSEPPLGYADIEGPWDNLIIRDAIARSCPNEWRSPIP